eukprot:414941_1
MSQKLYHGNTEKQLNAYDKEQFFFKTVTSFSTKQHVAKKFTKDIGMIFIINNGFEGLYNGGLRGANVQWLSNYPEEYEYVILPTTYNKINEIKEHKLSLNSTQIVYITSHFKTNIDPLKPHSDTVSTDMQVSYQQIKKNNEQKHNSDNNYSERLQLKYQSDFDEGRRNRSMRLCHIINCEFENADTIPSKQLDIKVFTEGELQHADRYHPYFYKRLTTWTKTTEDDMNSTKWDEVPSYCIQITYVDPHLMDFHVHIISNKASDERKKMYVKEMNGNGKVEQVLTINKGKHSAEVDIEIDEKHDGSYVLGIYDSKHAKKPAVHSTSVVLMIDEDVKLLPPNNVLYEPTCINLATLRRIKDEKNKIVHVYWTLPPHTYGEITYKIINCDKTERETISVLPYSVPFTSAFLPFKVCTMVTINKKVYESKPSEVIYICQSKN